MLCLLLEISRTSSCAELYSLGVGWTSRDLFLNRPRCSLMNNGILVEGSLGRDSGPPHPKKAGAAHASALQARNACPSSCIRKARNTLRLTETVRPTCFARVICLIRRRQGEPSRRAAESSAQRVGRAMFSPAAAGRRGRVGDLCPTFW